MHNKPKIYYFINNFNSSEIKNLNKNISLIYRNYDEKIDIKLILKLKNYCNKKGNKFFDKSIWSIRIPKFRLKGIL